MAFVKRDWVDKQKVTEADLDGLETRIADGIGEVLGAETSAAVRRRTMPADANANLYKGAAFVGDWEINSSTTAATITNLPAGAGTGVLSVSAGPGFQMFRAYKGGTYPELWFRGVTDVGTGAWSVWARIPYGTRPLPSGANVDTYKGGAFAGEWEINSGTVLSTIIGLPSGVGVGALSVSASTGFQMYREYKGLSDPVLWFRGVNNVSTGAWSAWRKVAFDTGAAPVKPDDPAVLATRHPLRREEARARRSGVIGTGGRAAIALRFDDWHDSFRDKAAPILRKYDMPAYMATTVRHVEEISLIGWPAMQTLAVDDGFEVFGHSWSHSAASGVTAFRTEIVESADYMETQMPAVKVEGWVQPGTGEGASAYDGFGTGESLSDYTDHPAGQLMLSRYGVVYGGRYGYLAPLVGDYKTGQLHVTWEGYDLATFQAKVREAQDAGAGLSMMMHPNQIGLEGGTMTAALFEECIAWLAAERDAGRVVILTGSGLAFADYRTPLRRNLLKPGLSSWTGSYWVETTNGVEWWKTITGTTLTQSISMQPHSGMRGAQVELVCNVEAPTGAVVRTKATATGLNAAKDHTLASGFTGTVRKCFTIPANLGYDGTVTLELGRVSGGEVRVSNPRLQAI